MSIANPRSLIFDAPFIFTHRHVARSGGKQQDEEKPMIEEMASGNEGKKKE